ncbi:aspartic peptidase domain-containing protein [Xylariales sp. PMI_506]|nr:aspartic peptidase domain-containing protein [Xylariales sp. PMI_506]
MQLSKLTIACALASLANAARVRRADGPDVKLLSAPITKVDRTAATNQTGLRKRYFGSGVESVIGSAYMATLDIGLGSPSQVEVLLDTGSFELWVNPNCTSSSVPTYCQDFGFYNPIKSTSSHNLGTSFSISYSNGFASGIYYTDTVSIAGVQIPNQQFGVANNSAQVWFGILGLAPGNGNGFIKYNTPLDSIVALGYANSHLFGLDLGSQGPPQIATTGEIVFGGVDKNKYAGNLAKVPTDLTDLHYVVQLSAIALQTPGSQVPISIYSTPIKVVVDTGTTRSLLPKAVVDALALQIPGAQPDNMGSYKVPCSTQSQPGKVSFSFSGVTISVPYSEFIWNGGGAENCYLGAYYSTSVPVYVLGDTFLRGAYVVFDQNNHALYMSNFVSCGSSSDLVPVPAGVDAAAAIPGNCPIPSNTTVPTYNLTITTTVTSYLPYTVTICDPNDPTCTLGEICTSTQAIITTYCPEDFIVPVSTTAPPLITTRPGGFLSSPESTSVGNQDDDDCEILPPPPLSTAAAAAAPAPPSPPQPPAVSATTLAIASAPTRSSTAASASQPTVFAAGAGGLRSGLCWSLGAGAAMLTGLLVWM